VDSGNAKYSSSDDGVLFNKDKTILVQYPAGHDGTDYTIPGSVTSIGMVAFAYCSSLTSVTIPGSVPSIDLLALSACDSLTSVTFAGSNTAIECGRSCR